MKQIMKAIVKRALPVVVAMLLLIQPVCAFASDLTISDTLNRLSYLTDSNYFVEFTSKTRSRSIRMMEGDYALVSPFHRVNTDYLSYSLSAIDCSDPSVVSVSFDREDNGLLGLKLHALSEGTAEITATYSTYTTRLGLNYTDVRGDSTFTQRISVTVESAGSVEVKLNVSGKKYASVKGVTLSMLYMKDTLSPEKLQEVQSYVRDTTQEYALSGLSESIEQYHSGIVNSVLNLMNPFIKKGADLVGGIINKVTGFLQGLLDSAERINHAYVYAKYASMRVPVFAPQNLTMTVTVTNQTAHDICNLSVYLTPDKYLSFSSITGPWESSRLLASGLSLAPGESQVLSAQIFPRFVYGTLSMEGEKVKAYTSRTTAHVNYTDLVTGKTRSVQKDITLDAYTTITQEKLDQYRRSLVQEYNAENVDPFTSRLLGGAFNGYKRWYGYSCFSQVFILACPVEAVILNADGEELAVLGQDGDAYAGDGITGFVSGETKYIIVGENATDNYRIAARATDEGSMDVLTYECDRRSGLCIKGYEALPLTKGDQFAFRTYPDTAADIGIVGESGEVTLLEATSLVDQDMIVAELTERGLSGEEAEAWASLLMRGAMPENLVENPTGLISLADFCALLLNIAENCFDIAPADPADESLSAVQKAAWAGLVPEELAQRTGEEHVTVDDAAAMMDRLLQCLDLADDESLSVDWAPLSPEEVGLAEYEQARDESTVGFFSERIELTRGVTSEYLTCGEAALLLDRLGRYAEAASERDSLIRRLCEAYTNSMSWSSEHAYVGLYATDPASSGNLKLDNFIFWFPGVAVNDALSGSLEDKLLPTSLFLYSYCLTGDMDIPIYEQDYDMVFCHELGGTCSDENGTVYRWLPICYMNKHREIYQDAVYLYVTKVREGAATDFIQLYQANADGPCTLESFLIADQDLVAAFLEKSLITGDHSAIPAEYFKTLEKGSSGSDVAIMQNTLIFFGYLTGEADGDYGANTAAAVSAYQRDKGLPETGVADPSLQAMLHAEAANVFRAWAQNHGGEATYQAAMDNLTQRESAPQYNLPKNNTEDVG